MRQDAAVLRFNLHAPEFDRSSERERYRWRAASVGKAVGAEQIGARLYELGDGERSHPYHFHHAVEEWLLTVAGSPRVRTPDGERVLRAGDIICFPAGPGGAHQVTGPGTVLILSESRALDAVEYPESGKLELLPQGAVFRSADAVDLWEGE
jgi:uncharacterized cupin superfamily protein